MFLFLTFFSFGLPSGRSGPPPIPGPLLNPLIGGLPGSSLLIGQQAACLQLARIKTQLALSQISNAIAAVSRAVASRSASNTPPCFVSTQAPSPTATAINLLNLLKVANMSHKLYNPYSSESQDYSPCQPPSAQVDPGNVREPTQVVPGSTPASIGGSFGTPMNPSNVHTSMHPRSMGYIPGQGQPAKSAMDILMKQARGSILMKPAPDQNVLGTAWPEVSLGSGLTGPSSTPICQGPFSANPNTMPSGIVSGASDLPSSYQTKSSEASCNFNPSSSRSAPNIPPSHYSHYSMGELGNIGSSNKPSSIVAASAQSTRWSGESIPSDCPSSSKNAAYSQARFTCESAMDILKRFNLQEEDLEALCAYPEDQLSPANLPYLLRDIHKKKANRLSAASPSSMVHQAQGSQCAPETTAGPGADVKCAVQAPSAFQQPSKVIEYGHTSKYTVGIRDGGHHSIGVRPRSLIESGLMGSSTSQSRETLQKDLAPAKHGCRHNTSQRSTTLSPSVYSPLPRTAAHSIQTADICPKKEPVKLPVAKRAAPKSVPKSTSHKPTPGTGSSSQRPAPGTGTTSQRPAHVAELTSPNPAQGAGTNSPRPATGTRTTSHKAAPGVGTTILRPTPASHVSIQRPPPVKPAGKRMPPAALISDYMGVNPELFPHTCSLCNKPCVGKKVSTSVVCLLSCCSIL